MRYLYFSYDKQTKEVCKNKVITKETADLAFKTAVSFGFTPCENGFENNYFKTLIIKL